MRQHKWLEFLKDYNFDLSHRLGKANVVVDALSRKPSYSKKLGTLKITGDLMEESRESQKLSLVITHEKWIDVKIRTNEVMRFHDKIQVLDVAELRKLTLQKGLSSGLSVQLGAMRMYRNLREMFGWFGLNGRGN
ncbi:hypothetical protein CR513_47097, partial [Mucuna pruriens]